MLTELQYDDLELLQSLTCLKKEADKFYLTYAGLLIFGKRASHRRLLPMVRVDYIRVPGNTWIEDPDNRFTTVDMRGSMLELVQRAFSLVSDDLPKGFVLPEPEEHLGIPGSVTRNPIIATIFHETNLAETKGSGIRTMRVLMEKAQMLPPTFGGLAWQVQYVQSE